MDAQTFRTARLAAGATLLLAALTGCGGGGDEEPPPLNLPPAPGIPAPPPPPPPPPTPPLVMTSIVRSWSFDRIVPTAAETDGDLDHRMSVTGDPRPPDLDGGELDRRVTIGGLTIVPGNLADKRAWLEAYSSDSGMTYWAGAQAPINKEVDGTYGGTARLEQTQYFRKQADDATLRYVITEVWVEALDENTLEPTVQECTYIVRGLCQPISAHALIGLSAYADLQGDGTFERRLVYATAVADLRGYHDHWSFDVYTHKDAGEPWPDGIMEIEAEPGGIAGLWRGNYFRAKLLTPLVIEVPLSAVPLRGTIKVTAVIDTEASTERQKESYVASFLRDPATTNSGMRAESTGLEAFEVPASSVPPVGFEIPEPEPCGSSVSGAIDFDLAHYEVLEGQGRGLVALRRTGDLQSAASVLLTSGAGTATAGADFEPGQQRLHFGVGRDQVVARVPILADGAPESDETVALTLSSPGGCVALGARTNATLTIVDDDSPPPAPTFYRVGGNVSGLAGTGLSIEDRAQAISRPIATSGAFEFDRNYSAGASYDVRIVTQPTNPLQVCSVSNGSGTVTATVSDVQITCVTPPPPSGLDPSFGSAGRVAESSGGIKALARLTDGSLVYATGVALGKVSASGVRDTAFGTAGTVANLFGNATSVEVFDIAAQTDGRIVVTGAARPSGATGLGTDFAVARFNPDGTRDTTFNAGNTVFVDFIGAPDRASRVLLQPDGRILLAGLATTVYTASTDDADFAVVRLHADGSLDTSFGTGGRATADLEQLDFGYAAALQPDGRIVVGGRVSRSRSDDSRAGFARFNSNGTLDPSFASGGTLFIDTLGEVVDLALQADGRVVATIPQSAGGGDFEFGVLRLMSDGSRDGSFGVDGWVSRSVGANDDLPAAIAVQADGRIVVLGTVVTGLLTADYSDFGIARFLADGTVDTSFGTGGAMTFDFLSSRDSAHDLLIQPDGRIVGAGGAIESLFSNRSALLRIIP